MTGKNLWRLTKFYGRLIGVPALKPRDGASLFVSVMGSNSVGYARRATGLDAPSTLLLANVLDCLLGKGGLMQKVNRGHARISWNVFDAEVCDEIVPCCIRMVFDYAAKPRRQYVLHVKTRIG